jgi:hypothetical protein
MSLSKSPLVPAAFLGLALWLAGAGNPLAAEEAATSIAPPAVRLGAVAPCRIVLPTFEPKAPSHEAVTPTRYPGGARLSLPVAAPCPARTQALDI